MAAARPLYAVVIKDATVSKDPKTMKSVATQAKKAKGRFYFLRKKE